MERKKVTIHDLQAKKQKGEPFTMVTAYDYPTAVIVDKAGIDAILVGDSLAMVVLGLPNTVSVTMEEMLHHCRAVARGAQYALLVGDMPFMSYQTGPTDAVRNAGRFLKEAGMDVVKLEGGKKMAPIARAIVDAGIPVMGHIGLTPQTISALGGFKVQGKDAAAAQQVIDDALALEDAGCFAIVLEAIPDRLAKIITERLSIPTIGIGAGPHCDGQVLVTHDMVGLFDRFVPKFVKRYVNVHDQMVEALRQFKAEVENRTFPGPEHCFTIKDEVLERLY
ncbi:MAG: 3-methyl-2-oxobutanoate hydroxymethyltransferase [Anaerolineae bacterium]|nr:3-methyl-2-oxobutanoate hydroxymethyltransferase [Anaerolineae bacterium]MDW8070446.1 3-methyl-2-oxobutanoate hydroxymethyltransferase [Anaerolineae bacterium]